MKNLLNTMTGWAYDRPYYSLLLVFGITFFLALGLEKLQTDSSNEGLFQKNDPVLQSYQKFQREFGRNDIVVAAISSDEVFSGEFMRKLKAFHSDLENAVPWLDDVTSIVNVDWMVASEDGGLRVTELGDEWPVQGNLPPDLQEEITSSSLYRDTLISSDGKMVLVIIRALSFSSITATEETTTPPDYTEDFFQDQSITDSSIQKPKQDTEKMQGLKSNQLDEFVIAIEEIAATHRNQGLDIRLAGGPLLDKLHHDAIHNDAIILVLAALLVILAALYLLFRTKTALYIPVIVILTALTSMLGLMGWLNVPITPVSQALPPLLMMAGVLDSVHLLGLYYANKRRGELARQALINAIDHSGMAVLFTTLTTAAGFLAFTVARMKPIADFGWFAAIGVILVLVYTLFLLPALIRLHPGRVSEQVQIRIWQRFAAAMHAIAIIGINHSRKVLLTVAVLVIIGIPGIMKISFSYDVLSWFPEDTPIRIDTLAIDEKVQATVPLEIIVDTGRNNGILTHDFMQRLRSFQDYAESINEGPVTVGRATSVVDALERIHSQLSGAAPTNAIPRDENLLHQEMLLYESGGAREIVRLVDRSYSKARITLRLAWADGRDMVPLREDIRKKAVAIFSDSASVEVTGTVDLVATGAVDLIKSMTNSYLFAAITISVMLIILWRSFKLGLLAMIPNFITIYLGVAIMGYLGMTMNMITVLLGGIALGLAVDDTVHIINGIRHKIRDEKATLEEAIESTLVKIGPMLVITSLVLAGGFMMFSFSEMAALSAFGLLLSLVILVALLFDLLVIPAIIKVFGTHIVAGKSSIYLNKDAA